MGQGKRKTRKLKIGEALKLLVDEEAGQAGQRRRDQDRGAGQRREQRHRLHRRDRQGGLAQRTRRRRGRRARACSATCCRWSKAPRCNTKYGMVKTDHILFIASRRLPPGQAERPDSRTAGALPDPRRAGLAARGRLRGHPDQHAGQPGQAVPGAAGHRRRDAGDHARGRAPAGADRLRRERAHREHRRAPPGHGDGAAARRGQLRRAQPQRPDGA